MKVNGIDTTDISSINGIDIINILSFNGVEIPPKYLLDEYPTASIAVALFKLRSAYTGSCIRIRRASNNNEQDIGFDSNDDLDEAAINSFCSGTTCFIRTVYDQSGSANNITQTTTSRQPQIYGSGSIFYQNGLPCLRGNGTSTGMNFTQITADGDSVFGVFKTDNTNINMLLGSSNTDYNSLRTELNEWRYARVSNPYISGSTTGFNTINSSVTTDQHIFYVDFGNSDLEGSVDNNLGTTFTKYGTASINFNQFMSTRIGVGGAYYLDGDMQLMIIYNGSKRSEASDIVTFINNKFTVY
jgi:hypothetical protein